LVAEANYGGRVTDLMDRRLISTILKDFYTRDILDIDDYAFSPSGSYRAPPAGSLDDFKKFALELPLHDEISVFGLHQNAEISKTIIETNQICDAVLGLLPCSGITASSLANLTSQREFLR